MENPNGMRIVQINLHHSEAASDDLLRFMEKEAIHVALIQEPWLVANKVRGFRSRKYTLFSPTVESKIRSCILARKDVKLFLLSNYSSGDLTVVALERKGSPTVILASAYLPYDEDDPPPRAVRTLVSWCDTRGYDLILGCDANAHHTLWGSTDINIRGESLLQFLLFTNLKICNKGNRPTFFNRIREQVIDITLVSDSDSIVIRDWKVSMECSFSDHNRIVFTVQLKPDRAEPYRNPRTMDKEKFRSLVELMPPPATERVASIQELEDATSVLSRTLREAYYASCKERQPSRKLHQPWWTPRLRQLRKECRRLFNKAKRDRHPTDWDNYRQSFNAFKRETRKAKRESWKRFCSDLENTTEASRLRKVLSKEPGTPGFLMKPDGNLTESSMETLELLMKTHFPGCEDEQDGCFDRNDILATEIHRSDMVDSIVDEAKVMWAVDSFKPFKSAGPDGIFPALLQLSITAILPWLISIFRGSLESGHIPLEWRKVTVVFIPKAGKINHGAAKDYRPISLSSFLLKTMERLIDIYVRNILSPENFCRAQHAYQKGKSVETALHDVVGTIEDTLDKKEYVLASFLDIEGAFNNVNISSIVEALGNTGADRLITNWTGNMLRGRTIISTLGKSTRRKVATRGTPQGGVLSPLLWNLVVNEVLFKLSGNATKVVAYADDVVLLIRGKFLPTISDLMESALSILLAWAKKNGLGINPTKTELVLFTRRYKIPEFRPPRLDGIILELSKEAKYLGVILDSKLTWKRNAEARMEKALCAFYACKRAFGKRWGLKPYIVHWMYTAVIRPILTYGALVWWRAVDKRTYLSTLDKVQRIASLAITGAMRSTPQASLNTLLDLTPLDIYIKYLSANSALRLRESGNLRHDRIGHGTILRLVGGQVLGSRTDYLIPVMNFKKPFLVKIPDRNDWKENLVVRNDAVSVYTDGSKMDTGTGSGIFSEELDLAVALRLPDTCTVFQAEIYAITEAARRIRDLDLTATTIDIFVDSLAAIRALNSMIIKSRCVLECIQSLAQLEQREVRIVWVPGHEGILGNEKADEYARAGSAMSRSDSRDDIDIPFVELSNVIKEWALERTAHRWSTMTTCRISRTLWPSLDRNRTKGLLTFERSSLSLLIGVITGHCMIGRMSEHMGILSNGYCRSCLDEEEEESVQHLLCDCPALQERRLKYLGNRFLEDLDCLRDAPLTSLLGFVKSSGRFSGARFSRVT